MSGYVAIITPNDKILEIRRNLNDSDSIALPLNEQLTLLYYSTAKSMMGNRLFQGYAIDHDNQRFIFPGALPNHIPTPEKAVDGSYFTALIEETQVSFGADLNGYVPLCWFSSQNITAISDSFLTLLHLRQELGLPCTLDEEVIVARMWLNSISYQQIGTETYCKEINFCTPGTSLHYSLINNILTEKPKNLVEAYKGSFSSHADAIHQAAARMIGVFKGYAETGGAISLGLSGGTDSRVCLAAALAADIGDALHVGSKDNGRLDYPIALEMSQRFNFPINRPAKQLQGELEARDSLTTWAAMNLGIYDVLYASNKFRKLDIPVFSVGGQGAEIAKGNYGWRPISDINMPPSAREQAQNALKRIGSTANDKWGSEWHYLAFRHPLHGGRALLNSDYVSRPAVQVPIIGLSRSSENEFPAPRVGGYNVIGDLLVCLNPEMALHRFDNRAKDFTPERLERRLRAIGGPICPSEVPHYSSLGSAIPSLGVLPSHVSVAEHYGFAGGITGYSLWKFAQESIKELNDVLPLEIISAAQNIAPNDPNVISSQLKDGPALSKLVALYPFISAA